MKEKRSHAGCGFFSIAFGLIIISIGLAWFLQIVGVLPEGIKILRYACPICVVLLGVRILTARTGKGNNGKQEFMGDPGGKM